MSSFRNHRIVIASLFLPTTAVLGESGPPTPEKRLRDPPSLAIPPSAFRSLDKPKLTSSRTGGTAPRTRSSSVTNALAASIPGPLKSIVEDLQGKSRNITPATLSPAQEIANPFFKAVRILTRDLGEDQRQQESPSNNQTSPPASRKHQTTHTDHGNTPARIQRKGSRSSSRRPPVDNDIKVTNGRTVGCWNLEANTHCNGGLKNAVQSVGPRLRKKLWVGTLGTATDAFSEPLRQEIDRKMVAECSSQPVWIPDAEFESCYDEFCHQVLWPCLHYAVPDAPKTKLFYESAAFKQYEAVNQRFADTIIENYQDGDIIWVNDYHLMLLPAMLRASNKIPATTPIGFFMHVAFPSSEIFRCLSLRQKLLKGLLGADLIGFQTASYARHFRQTVSRILSYEALPKGIEIKDGEEGAGRGRFVDVGVFPMGIDVYQVREKMRDPEVSEWIAVLKQRYAGLKLVVGRDKLDEVQGVRHKIRAFEMFLEKHPEFQQKVVLIQVALQTTETNEFAGGVADAVSHINSRFSTLTWQPVVFLHTLDLTFPQYLALLSVADAFLVTSLREGMALRTHEYVECQEERHRPLILSEFTGSYSYSGFRSCIAINPWDSRSTANAIHQALIMGDEEAKARWEDLHNHVITQTAQAFVTSFLTRCLRANTEHVQGDLIDVPSFNVARVLPRYRHSHKRFLLIDLEGTLWHRDISRGSLQRGAFNPPAEIFELLEKLADDKRNEVWLLSGLPVKNVLDQIAQKVPKIGIVAENGCFIKTRPSRGQPPTWVNMVANFNLTWKSSCLEILDYFTERTPGAFVEEREASIVWRFWTGPETDSPDRQWARRQAAEAQNHIFDSLGERYGLRIIPGNNSFLVLPNNISRSTAVGAILHPGGPSHSPLAAQAVWMSPDTMDDNAGLDLDCILAVSSDEKLLRRLNEFDNSETVSTSGKNTSAKWQLDAKIATKTLWQLANVVSA
ncbi:alpha,alpha-trehalose-phosphate synthase [Pleurotus eryngii]|uniref:Alpha,alpha-trehalose-phosphate synthase n=1 Tax=Pleurotus eryngii TaxID=5323 RepID=A0A9P5ZN79_PLEER|nr:alpha,alpha-trehalose-phosphate synthase [Pleurotus eryngii]